MAEKRMKAPKGLAGSGNRGGVSRARVAVFGLSLMLLASSWFAASAVRAATYNNVQVFVSPEAQLPFSYTFTVYNSTGMQVGAYQDSYPAAAFELPSGVYLFTVSAIYQNDVCLGCLQPAASNNSSAAGVADDLAIVNSTGTQGNSTETQSNSTGTLANSTVLPVVVALQSQSEYGYQLSDVTGSQTLNLVLANVTDYPTSNVTVRVLFANGTGVANASVSASIVGQWYSWWGEGYNVSMSAETSANGTASLILPAAPAVITAWDWVPVNLPPNMTTPVNVGGQTINVTEIWEPAYVGLSGSADLIPPENNVTIALQYQQPTYWAEPVTVETSTPVTSGSTSGTVASSPAGVPAAVSQATASGSQNESYQPSQIPAMEVGGLKTTSSQLLGGDGLAIVTASVLGAVVCATVGVTLAKRRRQQASEARA